MTLENQREAGLSTRIMTLIAKDLSLFDFVFIRFCRLARLLQKKNSRLTS